MRAEAIYRSRTLVTPSLWLGLLAVSALNLPARAATSAEPLIPAEAPSSSGWVLADLNGDQSVDLAMARPGRHELNGYAQEVRIKLGGFQQTSFRFQSRGAIVELSTLDVDGDDDGDLIVFEPLSTQPIGVWLNDGRGTFHEGRLADFRKLWSDGPGPAIRSSLDRAALLVVSEERIQPIAPVVTNGPPERNVAGAVRQIQPAPRPASSARYSPRGPPSNS